MVCRIRTIFSDSTLSYGGDDLGDWNDIRQGVLQGNASGSTIWVLVSSIIFEKLHKRGLGVKFCTSLFQKIFKLIGFSYIDSCNFIESGTNLIDILYSMQVFINSWSYLVEVTGGTISVDKSCFYLIDYVWAKGKWVTYDAKPDLNLVAKSTEGKKVSLKRLLAADSSEIL